MGRLLIRLGPRLAWPLCIYSISTMLAGMALIVVAGAPLGPGDWARTDELGIAYAVFTSLTCIAVGVMVAFVAAYRPENPFGWIGLVSVAISGTHVLLLGNASYAQAAGPAAPIDPYTSSVLAWGSIWLNLGDAALFVLLLLTFPHGQLPRDRWRWALWLAIAGALVTASGLASAPGLMLTAPSSPNPFPIPALAAWTDWLINGGLVLVALAIALAAAALFARLRRARGEERFQLRWIAYASSVWAVAFAFAQTSRTQPWEAIASFTYMAAIDVFTAAIAIAIFKYRLYQIDRLVSGALAYGTLISFIAAVYVGLVVGVGVLVGAHGPHGEPSAPLALLATAMVAVVFQPARARAERLANRLVYGQSASPYEVMSDFTRRMGGALSADEILTSTAEAVAKGLGAAHAHVRLLLPGPPLELTETSAGWSAIAGGPEPATHDRVVPVLHEGRQIGEIAVSMAPGDRLTSREARFLDDFAAGAGISLKNAQMTAELHARLADVSAQAAALRLSRQRIVAVQDATRRRLERDIHDGAQQHLVALAVTLRLARHMAEKDPAKAASLLDELTTRAAEALETLRELARGIFPPVLRDRGLVPALRAHLRRSAVPVHFECDGALETQRFDPRVEAGVYFCCVEALQNAARHAPGATAVLQLTHYDGNLGFAVHDRGPGFDPASIRSGTGLQSMADRIAALGGTLAIDSAPGVGATISGEVPIVPVESAELLNVLQASRRVALSQAAASVSGPNSDFGR